MFPFCTVFITETCLWIQFVMCPRVRGVRLWVPANHYCMFNSLQQLSDSWTPRVCGCDQDCVRTCGACAGVRRSARRAFTWSNAVQRKWWKIENCALNVIHSARVSGWPSAESALPIVNVDERALSNITFDKKKVGVKAGVWWWPLYGQYGIRRAAVIFMEAYCRAL